MINDMVREAMRRVRKNPKGYTDFDRGADCALLASAYLSEHPADEDEPMTEALAVALGGTIQHLEDDDSGPAMWIADWRNGEYKLSIWSDGKMSISDAPEFVDCSTLGQFRRLAAALGIELKAHS